jgi:peroxiredoxin
MQGEVVETMALEQELAAFKDEFTRTAPEGRVALYEAKIEELRAAFAQKKAIGIGDKAPGFALAGIHGREIRLDELLREGPVMLTFYRGGWCPYCNLQLRACQAALSEFAALGARLVAVSPQLPDDSLDTAKKNALTFDVLSDVGNAVAWSYGLVYALPFELREALRSNGKTLSRINGDESWELPVPATYVIDTDGRVLLASLHVDYRTRVEPDAILAALRTARS